MFIKIPVEFFSYQLLSAVNSWGQLMTADNRRWKQKLTKGKANPGSPDLLLEVYHSFLYILIHKEQSSISYLSLAIRESMTIPSLSFRGSMDILYRLVRESMKIWESHPTVETLSFTFIKNNFRFYTYPLLSGKAWLFLPSPSGEAWLFLTRWWGKAWTYHIDWNLYWFRYGNTYIVRILHL